MADSDRHAMEAFGINAIDYIIKPVTKESVFRLLDRAVSFFRTGIDFTVLRVQGRLRRIPVMDIVLFEAEGKRQKLYLTDGRVEVVHLSMKKLEEQMRVFDRFERVGMSYLVNLEHVNSLNAKSMTLDDGQEVFLPRGTYPRLKEAYLEYYRSRVP